MTDRLLVLDAQRGLCALFVALLHAKGASQIADSAFIQGSWLFVDYFFVLSGFVIALVYIDRIDTAKSFIAFVARRFGRLWPLHAFVLMLYVASEFVKWVGHGAGVSVHTQPFSGTTSIGTIGANLLMVHSLGLYETTGWNVPSWSISLEFYTYLLFAMLCVTVRRSLAVVAVILAAASILMLSVWSSEYLGAALHFGIFRCLYGFFVGVLTFLAYRAARRRGSVLPAPSLLEAASIGLAVAFVIAARDGGAMTMAGPIVFAAVVFVFAFEAGPFSRLLRMRAFTWLGDRSYALYMIHSFVGDSILRVLLFLGALLPVHAVVVASGPTVSFGDRYITDLIVILYALAALAGAGLVHRAVERPGRALFNRLTAAYIERPTSLTVPATV
jgi:peptidoglycan/LPS O-acetylase OafA/YrhL